MSRRYRVLYVEKPTDVGGSVISLYELVRGLDTNLYQPVVLLHGPNPYREKFQALGVTVAVLNEQQPVVPPVTNSRRDIAASLGRYHKWLAAGYRTLKEVYLLARHEWPMARRIAGLIKSEAIDLVHHNNSLTANMDTVLAARLAGIPQVCHVRTLRPFSPLEGYFASDVDAFIYISRAVEQVYLGLGIPAGKDRVIYDAFNPENFTGVSGTAELRAEFGLTDQDLLISNVGRLDWWKGQDYFVEAMAEVIRTCPTARALVVGTADATEVSQNYYRRLQQMVTDLKMTQHVIFTGFRNDVARIMAASNVVVHSASEPEPFGIVIIEAMGLGRPVVATAAGGVLDIIDDRVTGWLVPPRDAHQMAQVIKQLWQNQAEATLVARRAQQRIQERFSVEQHVAGVQQVYRQVLAGKPLQ